MAVASFTFFPSPGTCCAPALLECMDLKRQSPPTSWNLHPSDTRVVPKQATGVAGAAGGRRCGAGSGGQERRRWHVACDGQHSDQGGYLGKDDIETTVALKDCQMALAFRLPLCPLSSSCCPCSASSAPSQCGPAQRQLLVLPLLIMRDAI